MNPFISRSYSFCSVQMNNISFLFLSARMFIIGFASLVLFWFFCGICFGQVMFFCR
jgi:hypothetical protein